MANIVCPLDGKDDTIQKVSAVVASGSGTAPYRDYEGYTSYRNVKSELARLLSPPAKPNKPGVGLMAWIIGYVTGLGLVPVAIADYQLKKRDKARYEALMAERPYAMERWNRSYYCSKHDVVFDPDTGDSAPPQQMQEFLARAYKP